MLTPSILTICVNYNNDEETADFVKGLLAQKGISDQRVIVVDNSETPLVDGLLHDLANKYWQIWLHTPGKNLGYYGGAALGLCEYIKEFPLPDWVIVCNTDIDLIQPDFLSKFCDLYSVNHHAVIAPAIISNLSGKDQNPYMQVRPSQLRMHSYKWIFRYPILLRIYEDLSFLKQKISKVSNFTKRIQHRQIEPINIYAPHGSFIIFHRSYFETGGTLNHGVFLFGEEIFVAETVRQLGLQVIYDLRLRVLHKEHSTTNIFKSTAILKAEAAAYCADTFFTSKAAKND